MTEKSTSRRNFLQLLGLSAGAALLPTETMAGFVDHKEILKLTPEQQTFLLKYEIWMDDFIKVIHLQKENPQNSENHANMLALSQKAEDMKPELTEFMKDEKFFKIYQVSIQRMTNEIEYKEAGH